VNKTAQSRFFYGWYVLAASSTILFLAHGAKATFGVMFKPILNELHLSRSHLSFAVFLNTFILALSLTLVGKLYDRYGAKWVLVVATLALAGGHIGMAFVHQSWQLMILYGVVSAIGFGGASVSLLAALSARWFHRHRGMAIGLAIGGCCLGQYILVPLTTHLMLGWGWRQAIMIMGLIILIVNMVLTFKVIRDNPQQIGLEPYGHEPSHAVDSQRTALQAGIHYTKDFGLREAMRTRSFWLFLVIMVICGGGDSFILTHLIPLATDHGFSPSTAGHMLAWSGLLSLPGVLITGPVTDRIGNKIPIMITFALRLGVFTLVLKYQNLVSFYVLALAFGFTMLITAPICVTLLGRMYGFLHMGLLSGFINTLHHLGGGAWAFLGGFIYDQTGSYHLAFLLSAISAAVAVVCAVFIREERHRKIAA